MVVYGATGRKLRLGSGAKARETFNDIDFVEGNPDGLDWYQNNTSGEYVWYEGSDYPEGYTNKGAYYILDGDNEYIIASVETFMFTN